MRRARNLLCVFAVGGLAAILSISPAAGAEKGEIGVDGRPGRPGGLALGLGLGHPTSLNLSWWSNDRLWVEAGLGTGFAAPIVIHADLHYALVKLRPEGAKLAIPIRIGGGGLLGFGDAWYRCDRWGCTGRQFYAGVRLPIGLEIWPDKLPISGFVELAPQLTSGWWWGGADWVGGRFGIRLHLR